jgi:hypothetical protein
MHNQSRSISVANTNMKCVNDLTLNQVFFFGNKFWYVTGSERQHWLQPPVLRRCSWAAAALQTNERKFSLPSGTATSGARAMWIFPAARSARHSGSDLSRELQKPGPPYRQPQSAVDTVRPRVVKFCLFSIHIDAETVNFRMITDDTPEVCDSVWFIVPVWCWTLFTVWSISLLDTQDDSRDGSTLFFFTVTGHHHKLQST